jgi:hypothetical protein
MDTPLLAATFQIVVGGVIVFLAGILIGNSWSLTIFTSSRGMIGLKGDCCIDPVNNMARQPSANLCRVIRDDKYIPFCD